MQPSGQPTRTLSRLSSGRSRRTAPPSPPTASPLGRSLSRFGPLPCYASLRFAGTLPHDQVKFCVCHVGAFFSRCAAMLPQDVHSCKCCGRVGVRFSICCDGVTGCATYVLMRVLRCGNIGERARLPRSGLPPQPTAIATSDSTPAALACSGTAPSPRQDRALAPDRARQSRTRSSALVSSWWLRGLQCWLC